MNKVLVIVPEGRVMTLQMVILMEILMRILVPPQVPQLYKMRSPTGDKKIKLMEVLFGA